MAKKVIGNLIDNPLYLETVRQRMLTGKLAPAFEQFLWQFVHGRPSEAPKDDSTSGPVPVKIIHEFTTTVTHEDK